MSETLTEKKRTSETKVKSHENTNVTRVDLLGTVRGTSSSLLIVGINVDVGTKGKRYIILYKCATPGETTR